MKGSDCLFVGNMANIFVAIDFLIETITGRRCERYVSPTSIRSYMLYDRRTDPVTEHSHANVSKRP